MARQITAGVYRPLDKTKFSNWQNRDPRILELVAPADPGNAHGMPYLWSLVIASFVTGPSATTLPMAVFSSVRLGVSPEVKALATLFLAVVFVLVSAAFWLIARAERRRRSHRFPPL